MFSTEFFFLFNLFQFIAKKKKTNEKRKEKKRFYLRFETVVGSFIYILFINITGKLLLSFDCSQNRSSTSNKMKSAAIF